jgi:hypothetical protein
VLRGEMNVVWYMINVVPSWVRLTNHSTGDPLSDFLLVIGSKSSGLYGHGDRGPAADAEGLLETFSHDLIPVIKQSRAITMGHREFPGIRSYEACYRAAKGTIRAQRSTVVSAGNQKTPL